MTPLQRYIDAELLRRLSTLTVSGRTVAAGTTTGRHHAPVRGNSIEFRQHRYYTPGDEPRRIDWRVLARTDRAFVREYEQETNLRCLLLLDASGSMSYGVEAQQKLLYARRAAAAMSYVMLGQTESVGLATFGGTTQYVPPQAGNAQLARLLDALDRTVPDGPGTPHTACHAAANRLRRRTLVVLMSDFFTDPVQLGRGLARLRHDRHEVALVRVLHRDEIEFPFQRWCRFEGAEGEAPCVAEPAEVRRDYLHRFAQHRTRLLSVCSALSVSLYEWPTDRDLGDAVTGLIFGRQAAHAGEQPVPPGRKDGLSRDG